MQNRHDSHATGACPRNTGGSAFFPIATTHFLDLNDSRLQAIFPRAAHSME
jgi:hypothetical protein